MQLGKFTVPIAYPVAGKRVLSPLRMRIRYPDQHKGPRGATTHVPLLDYAPRQVYRGVANAQLARSLWQGGTYTTTCVTAFW